MHQLRALTWKSYKVRSRSYYITVLDLLGPSLIILFYIAIKFVVNFTHDVQVDEEMKAVNYFHNSSLGQINLKQGIQTSMCHRILYHSSFKDDGSFSSYLTNECGFQLEMMSSRNELVTRLRRSLDLRIAFKQPNVDLNRSNKTADNCIVLPTSNNSSAGPIYQIGIVRTSSKSVEIHMTDSAGSSVIHIPYSQGSSYNEYRLPVSDLNLGVHLIEICLANASKRRVVVQSTSTTRSPNVANSTNRTDGDHKNPLKGYPRIDRIKWRIAPYPYVTGVFLIPVATALVILIAFFCTNIATAVRVADANENGLHRYARLSGTSSSSYWLGELLVSIVTNFMHSLIIGILLGTTSGGYPYDPICDIPMMMRWLILFTYSLAATSVTILIASLFNRSSHALLTFCLIASMFAMYPLLLILQWTPYGFKSFDFVFWLAFFNPAALFEALCIVIASVSMQSNETFGWSSLLYRIVGGSFTGFSTGELWGLLVAQILISLILTILIDEYRFTTANFIEFVPHLLYALRYCFASGSTLLSPISGITKTKTVKSAQPNPNRICCSLRNIQVRGKTRMMPHTKDGNVLMRVSRETVAAKKLADANEDQTAKTSQFLVNWKLKTEVYADHDHRPASSLMSLDDAIKQHVVWYKTTIKLENLSLNFHFNQVTFVLGQTDLKELLFDTLLGLNRPDEGSIIIEDVKYSPTAMSEARRHIGYLSERDVFYHELTIFENLQLFGSIREPEYKSFDSESLYVLSLLHLTNRRNDLPATLTHRSARKLAIAVALVGYTKLLLLTEPTLNLKWRPRCQVYNLLKKYKSIRSIVVDTSDVDEAVAFGDRIVLLRNGSTDLNDDPKRLATRLGCGYRIVFEPITSNGRSVNSQSIKALERLTNDIFKQDKIDLDATKHSIYDGSDYLNANQTASKTKVSPRSPKLQEGTNAVADDDDRLHRTIVVVKINQTAESERGICSILRMFASNNVGGLRLAQLNYESLEDILVLRMSRAIYPNLPPDLLLSLQHRFQTGHKTRNSMPISIQKLSARLQPHEQAKTTVFNSSLLAIIKDRFGESSEVILSLAALLTSLLIVAMALLSLRYSLKLNDNERVGLRGSANYLASADRASQPNTDDNPLLEHTMIEQLYRYRVGFYVLERDRDATSNTSNGIGARDNNSESLLKAWGRNKNLLGMIKLFENNETSAQIVARLIDKSRDLAGSFIIYDPRSSETIVIYEPHLPHMLLASIRTFANFALSLDEQLPRNLPSHVSLFDHNQSEQQDKSAYFSSPSTLRANDNSDDQVPTYLTTSRFNFDQSWHAMIQGFYARRLVYGIGFALAEGLTIGVMLLAPIRHRSIVIPDSVKVSYWFRMAIVDLFVSCLNIVGYLILFITIEGLTSIAPISSMLLVFFLYKLASLPIPYLTSLVAETSLFGFLFIILLYFTIAWDFDIFLRSYIDWAIISNPYAYTISNWVLFGIPLTGLIESLVIINQVNTIASRCQYVPAYAATKSTIELEGIQKTTVVDDLLEKVRECLANGKTFVDTDVLHGRNLGIIWSIYLILLFAMISWMFLLTAERFFGLTMRRFSSKRTSLDPMKAVVRVPDPSSSLFVWDKERDRLVSDFIRCLNEIKYAKVMAKNCLILRVWLKPLDNRASADGRLANVLDPLMGLGYTKNNVQVELRTTLQIFIRLGDESKQCRVDKADLIEAFSRYTAAHSDIIAKFAVVDWTRENLYKILLHGYYNNKTMLPS